MRKILCMLAVILVAFAATNCKKEMKEQPTLATQGELQFNINSVFQNHGSLKDLPDTIICTEKPASYVMYKFVGEPLKRIPVFYIGSIPWTNAIKLSAGAHVLEEFYVMNDNNTPTDFSDDILLEATPHVESVFAKYVTTPLLQDIYITVDKKLEFKIDVCCFKPAYYNLFGFVYFYVNEIIIREQCFFGDFCIKNKADYNESPYAEQTGWLGNPGPFIDVPAIFKIKVYRNDELQETFQNSNQGEKLCITYADYKQQVDHFKFELYILVKQGPAFVYLLMHTWVFDDISNIEAGQDGVVDFVLGNCYDPANPPDLVMPPWMNLPATCTYQIPGSQYAPGVLGAYVDALLGGIPAGYEIHNGLYASWCADHETNIYLGSLYFMNVYSSLHPELLPPFAADGKWAKINWMFNHLDWYPGYHWYDLQQVIWLYDNPPWNGVNHSGVPDLTPLATQIKADCDTYGVGYVPPPGGWATIIFIPTDTPPGAQYPTVQTMIIKIDP